MPKPLLALCGIPKIATRDGYAGPNAHFILPFSPQGIWFASGQVCTFPGGTLPQDRSLTLEGTVKADTFTKAVGNCLDA